ncbi:bifunctional protein-serine/threonine kinase/phosphatase [Chelatococcus reniformis]|uniref:Protein kinase n=1 Tax=Chelatococcus reniformis TaxID=1494448 RepID=A0A916XH89_9HYPH|nr:bifunctional protein-serine/threonine kinase/phosphatase [Chelatococcus reniformis]GGC73351.1 protein kinase [Chelatococcus reniformis]
MPPLSRKLTVTIGQSSDKGRKEINQDCHGVLVPDEPLLSLKGIAVALADGISSSSVGRIASEAAVRSFLSDYYCTSDSWAVKTSAQRVIAATNSWLHAQTRRGPHPYDKDKGYVCTFSVMVLKSATAHLFHVGDARIYRVSDQSLEQLTTDHRVRISSEQTYLARALGMNPQIEIDYQALPLGRGDIFIAATDGVYEHVGARRIIEVVAAAADDLDGAARDILAEAYDSGSPDNLTVQIIRIDDLPDDDAQDILGPAAGLPAPPLLEARQLIDGYRIVRPLHASSRSHIYLAVDPDDEALVAIKIPSIDLRDDPAYLKRFAMEEWVARRIDSPHVLKPRPPARERSALYVVTEFIDGQTLAQWMIDHPRPDLATVRAIVEQIAAGLRAFHRKEMLHQDLRPANVMIDKTGTAKIIDFGSVHVAGVVETAPSVEATDIQGTHQYAAPEYFIGEAGSPRSDIYSLGVITYQMLTGRLPYGTAMATARTRSQQRRLRYATAFDEDRETPAWIDETLRQAVHPDPHKRYAHLSEFVYDLRHPRATPPRPLAQRNPLLFWKLLSLALTLTVAALLFLLSRR